MHLTGAVVQSDAHTTAHKRMLRVYYLKLHTRTHTHGCCCAMLIFFFFFLPFFVAFNKRTKKNGKISLTIAIKKKKNYGNRAIFMIILIFFFGIHACTYTFRLILMTLAGIIEKKKRLKSTHWRRKTFYIQETVNANTTVTHGTQYFLFL